MASPLVDIVRLNIALGRDPPHFEHYDMHKLPQALLTRLQTLTDEHRLYTMLYGDIKGDEAAVAVREQQLEEALTNCKYVDGYPQGFAIKVARHLYSTDT